MSWIALREGGLTLLVAVVVTVWGWHLAGAAGAVPGALALAATLWFFRDPERLPPEDPDLLVAPADGRIVEVEDDVEIPALGGRGRRISIFLSVLDVHVNRAPAAAQIVEVTHASGSFLDARDPGAPVRNERQTWVLESTRGAFAVVQIAGLIARRIVAWRRSGDRLVRGERIGMIRFGSRTDLLLPPQTQLLVRAGDRVFGGRTAVARWHPAGEKRP